MIMKYILFLYSMTLGGVGVPAGTIKGDLFEAPMSLVANILDINACCSYNQG